METTRSPFLDQKRKTAFHFFDVTKDGFITKEDFIAIADYISEKTGAKPEQSKKLRQEWVKWMTYLQPDPSITVNEDRFVEICEECSQDTVNYRILVFDWASTMFDTLDFNGDGQISLDELKIFYGAVGLTNEQTVSDSFRQWDEDGDGFIKRDQFVDDIYRYFTSTDPNDGRTFFIWPVNKPAH